MRKGAKGGKKLALATAGAVAAGRPAVVPVGVATEAAAGIAAGRARKTEEDEPIRIEIGRIDVRAAPPQEKPSAPARKRFAPGLTLAEYLRRGGRRG